MVKFPKKGKSLIKKGLLFGLVVGVAIPTIVTTDVFAVEDGASLLESRCSVCHSSATPKSK